jgi:CRISPR/Cas system-associated endonuclease Cas3-HD
MNSAQKTLAMVRVCGEMMKRAQVEREQRDAERAAVQGAIKEATTQLLRANVLYENTQDAVISKIASSHAASVELIGELAARLSNGIGKPIPATTTTKSAGVRHLGDHVADFDETESGRRFAEQLMGHRQ